MHSRSDNIEIVINDEADKVIKELSDSLKNRSQNNLKSTKGNKFFFIMLIYCITNIIKEFPIMVDQI